MIAIIDYGAGNLHSVKNALDFLNAESIVTGDSETILNADKVILPGVGAFGDAMKCPPAAPRRGPQKGAFCRKISQNLAKFRQISLNLC